MQHLPFSETAGPDMRRSFHQQLDALDDEFTTTALFVAEAIPRLARAYLDGELAALDEARAMVREVGDRCAAVEETGFVLIARESPVGGDLRRLVAMLRTTTDVDRSASLLRHVVETLRVIDPRELDATVRETVTELAKRAADIFRRGIDAWRRRDGLAVTELDRDDDAVDALARQLLVRAERQPDPGTEMLILGLLARYFERIADHGVALARDAAFVVTGERVAPGR